MKPRIWAVSIAVLAMLVVAAVLVPRLVDLGQGGDASPATTSTPATEEVDWADEGYGMYGSLSWIRFEGGSGCEDANCVSYSIVAGQCLEPVVTVEGQGSAGNRLWSREQRVEVESPERPESFTIVFDDLDTVRVEITDFRCE